MNCEFCDEPNHDQGVTAMTMLFDAVLNGEQGETWLDEKGHVAWRDFRRATSISIPNDGALLASWLDRIS